MCNKIPVHSVWLIKVTNIEVELKVQFVHWLKTPSYDRVNSCLSFHRLRGGELFDYISKKDFLTEEEAIDFTRQILLALQHLHSRNVVHLDLKVRFKITIWLHMHHR